MRNVYKRAMGVVMPLILFGCLVVHSGKADMTRSCGYVGLRPLPRYAQDLKSSHGGPWAGLPTFEQQKGNYPFVAEHLDVVKGWLDGDFKTKRLFFEHYWGINKAQDDLDPEKNFLVKKIRNWESQGGVVEHILICREYRLAIHRGHPDAKPGPFKEDTRILFAKDVDNIRELFRNAHKQGILKHDNYKLIQMVEEPSFFADERRAQAIIEKMEGVAYEAHQFNRHWPLETGWSKPENVVRGAKWTLDQGKEYIFYYGPIIWKSKHYYEFIERDWLYKYWKAGLPKHHPRLHYYLNTFPHAHGRGRPIGPETDPHSVLGLTKWLIQEIKMRPKEKWVKPDKKVPYKTVTAKDGGKDELELHIFEPKGHKPGDKTPAIVFFFGGGWRGGTPAHFYPQSQYLASRGMVAICVEYRTAKSHGTSPQECVKDGKSAIRWVRKNASKLAIDPNRLAAGGGSAGGHVAAACGTVKGFNEPGEDTSISCVPNALVLFNPVYDNSSKGFGNDRVKDYWQQFSPMHNIKKSTPPTIVFLGTKDKLIPVATAKKYKELMEKAGVRSDLHIYQGQKHGFFNKHKYKETLQEADKFLVSLGYLKKPEHRKDHP